MIVNKVLHQEDFHVDIYQSKAAGHNFKSAFRTADFVSKNDEIDSNCHVQNVSEVKIEKNEIQNRYNFEIETLVFSLVI